MTAFDLHDAREFWNGAWTILCTILLLMLLAFLIENLWRNAGNLRRWYYEPGTRVASALTIFISGSTLRAAWIWLRLTCEDGSLDDFGNFLRGSETCNFIYTTGSFALEVSGFLAITGAVCLVRVLAPKQWLPWSWIGALLLATALPVMLLW